MMRKKNRGNIFRVNAYDDWINGAYDEEGSAAVCDICGEPLRWNPVMCNYYCEACGREMSRAQFFNHIGATPPRAECLTSCEENYPLCREGCVLSD